MKNLTFLLFLIWSFHIHAQDPNTPLGVGGINEKYLEHLIKIKVDSVRGVYDCKPLVNDSILYIAAEHHANFMLEANRLSHYEEENEDKRTPQLRAEFFGAKNYFVGENVLKTNANSTITTKKKRVFNTSTYDALATSIVHGWVNSPGHFKNIITPEYQITGVAVAYKNGKVYACQKFAQVLYKYTFEESPTLFQYSDYEPEPVISSFAGVQRKLLANYKYDWGLRHDQPEKCDDCNRIIQETPYITLRYERGNFILRVENSEFVEELIQDRRDGFAVEIVEYNDYACGNPEYYTKPSRRNEQLKTNGVLLEPLYRKELMKGYKKRKKKKEVKFLSYLFGADSVKFKNRRAMYEKARYSSEYFEIKLGKLPKGVSGLWAHNLIYIQDGQICHVDYFTGHCPDLYMDTVAFDFMPLDTVAAPVSFKDQEKKQFFEIPFEQNKSTYSADDIAPFIESLKNVEYTVDSIHIKAYASVEGDSVSNHLLLRKRAESILAIWQANQKSRINATVETEIYWKHFYNNVRADIKHRELARADKATVIEALNDPATQKDLERILKAERKADITLFIRVPAGNQNIGFLIGDDWKTVTKKLENPDLRTEEKEIWIDSLNRLYALAHQKTVAGILQPSDLANLQFPERLIVEPFSTATKRDLMAKFLLYGYEFPVAFGKNEQWQNNHTEIRRRLSTFDHQTVSPVFWYDHAYFETRTLMASKKYSRESIQRILDILHPMRNFYYADTVAKNNIESLIFNLNMFLLNTIFTDKPLENTEGAEIALNQIAVYYLQRDTIGPERVLNMAKMAVYYNNNALAQQLTVPYFDQPEIIQYIVPLAYVHSSDPLAEPYYQYLIQLAEKLESKTWCALFMTECGIPFQAFDHEGLRDTYCEICN